MPPFKRTVDKPTGKVYIDPLTGIPTELVPAGTLTPTGAWVPLMSDENGVLFVQSDTTMVGTPHFDDSQNDITPGLEQTLIDETVPANTTRNLSQLVLSTRVTGAYSVMAGAEMIMSGRTGPGTFPVIPFSPPRPLEAGTEYQVLFTSRLNAPVQGVECYLQSTDTAA